MPRPVLTGSFTVLSFPDPADTDVAYFSEVKGRTVSQEGETEIQAIRTEFDQISGVALPQQESADLISELLRRGDQTICRGRRGFTQANEA